MSDDAPARWVVFDPDGVMLGTVIMPARFGVHQIGRDFVLGRSRGDMDVEHVLMYRLIKPRRTSQGWDQRHASGIGGERNHRRGSDGRSEPTSALFGELSLALEEECTVGYTLHEESFFSCSTMRVSTET